MITPFFSEWDRRFLSLAEHISSWSKDPSTKVGAVIVDDRKVVGMGYNGFPRGIADDERLQDRETKYDLIVHGEMNAIINANRSVAGCTLYTWPFMPCVTCAKFVIQAGITRVVAPEDDNPRWIESFAKTQRLFAEGKVKLDIVNLGSFLETSSCSCCEPRVPRRDGEEHRKTS